MTNELLSKLNATRKLYGCGFDQDTGSTWRYARRWSKKLIDGQLKQARALDVPAIQEGRFPRHEPLLMLLKEKYKDRNFGWTVDKHVRVNQTVSVLKFYNYPGANKGHLLTLADLFILPAEEIDEYAEALCKEQKSRMPRKTKRRRGAGCYSSAAA